MGDYKIEERVLVFCDAHSFSMVMLELGDRYPDFIQAYYEQVGEAVVGRGGELIKYIGDALFCAFPSGDEVAAVECGREMRKRYQSIIEKFGVCTDSDLEIGIGCGEVVIGIFGHDSLRTRDVFGEKVNQVAIIMHHRGIAVTEDVKKKLGARYRLKRLSDIKPKWSTETMAVWEVG